MVSLTTREGQGTPVSATSGQTENDEASESRVKVAVRVRPLIGREAIARCRECITEDFENKCVSIGKRRFTFDHVFGRDSTQNEIFDTCASQLVDGCFSGYNATVLAYGQTGSGKTFTMGSGINLNSQADDLGIIPRTISRLFAGIEERKEEAEFTIRCSFLEIYNEQVKDLLHPDTPVSKISIRENANGSIIVAGIKDEAVTTAEELSRLLESGAHVRTTGSTLMNEQSSRSHAVFTVVIEQRKAGAGGGRGGGGGGECSLPIGLRREVTTAKFHLVDLAGSERNKKTGTVGTRFKESVTINQGLLALGNVISALGDERKRGSHVPYRESKLTRMLQDSLGGNSRTAMIACVSSAEASFEETVNTLKYANRARNIRNKPIINRDVREEEIQMEKMKSEMEAIQQELDRVQGPFSGSHLPNAWARESMSERQGALEQETEALRRELLATKIELSSLRRGEALPLHEKLSKSVSQLLDVCKDSDSPQLDSIHEIAGGMKCLLDDFVAKAADDPENLDPNVKRAGTMALGVVGQNEHEEQVKSLEGKLESTTALLRQRESSLLEAQEDLARDEIIFAEKLEQLRKAETRAELAESEIQSLKIRLGSFSAREDAEMAFETPGKSSASPGFEMYHEQRGASAIGDNKLAYSAAESDDEVMIADDVSDEEDAQENASPADMVTPPPPTRKSDSSKSSEDAATMTPEAAQFQKLRASYERQMTELSINIKQKESFIRQLTQTEREAKQLSQQLENRMNRLEAEVKQKEMEVDSLRDEIDSMDYSMAKTEEDKNKMRKTYEEKLRKVEAQLSFLKKQRKEQESIRLEKIKIKGELKIQALNTELERMKNQQDILRKKVKEAETRNHSKQDSRKLVALKKETEASQRRVKELEAENEKQREKLEKRGREIAVAQKRLKKFENAGAKSPSPMTVQGRSVGHKSVHASPSRPNSADTKDTPLKGTRRSEAHNFRRIIEHNVSQHLKENEINEELKSHNERKQKLFSEKSDLVAARNVLDLKRQQCAKDRSNEIMQLRVQIEQLELSIFGQGNIDSLDEEQVRALQDMEKRRQEAYSQRAELEDKQKLGVFLSANDENSLAELEDRIDAVDTELEYLTSTTAELEKDLAEIGMNASAFHRMSDKLSLAESKSLIQNLVNQLCAARNDHKHVLDRMNTLEVVVTERERALADLGGTVRLLERSQDKRVSELKKVHDQQVGRLSQQVHALGRSFTLLHGDQNHTLSLNGIENIQEEIHDGVYTMQSSIDLKRQLRDVMAAGSQAESEKLKLVDANLKQAARAKELERVNRSLMLELENYKAHLRRTGSAMRVSRRDVRPMSAAAISARRSLNTVRSSTENPELRKSKELRSSSVEV